MSEMIDVVRKMKQKSPRFGGSSISVRNDILRRVRSALEDNKEDIFVANKKDLDEADRSDIAEAVKKRLKFDGSKLSDVLDGIDMLIGLDDPVGKVTLRRELDEGLTLVRQTVPIGVIGVIFEARPDALVQIASLCIKSGNCAILKGGKETKNTNIALFEVIHKALTDAGADSEVLSLAQTHAEIDELLGCEGYVDLLIPRGSNKFVKYIMDNTSIPVMGHADGICHIYVDSKYDADMAVRVIVDAKIQYTAACNAVETLLVNRDIAEEFIPKLASALSSAGVSIRGTKEVTDIIQNTDISVDSETIGEDDFDTEYLAPVVGVKLVSDADEAIEHINTHGSHHTDCVITTDDEVAEKFMSLVDSAGVYHNCSTRFADGFRYGFGAEVGISTAKLHARGPVGLEGLVTYKYKLYGTGQIVGDYASGVSVFTHKDLD